ncbi:MAG: bifunctional phosphopantothenoylcysteine decarboxylase/phosphopantothenate--cysteine ligase CoaBC [Saprospiraceae bacterium]|nr:bifunctional phosphopantothenoylcysteine decarboxylase/phosphopantothenate--cysteine ligase CoaBC [Saprospiraceae bacterium]
MTSLKVVVGISGSIAAYKAALLVRFLIKAGHEVRVVMTPAATEFISPLTLSTLSRNQVYLDVISEDSWNNHVEVGLWADLMIVAPATANTVSKMANGLCDNMLLAVYLSAKCPVWVAPAMDLDMWQHPATQNNIRVLKTFPSCRVLSVGTGELASGLEGPGRMMEPFEIMEEIGQWVHQKSELNGVKALVTAGPTREYIDPVRFLGNPSTGKMGVAIANSLAERGANVSLVLGPGHVHDILDGIDLIRVESAQEMYEAAKKNFPEVQLSVFAAAVADYKPAEKSDEKSKKTEGEINLKLVRTPDIALELGRMKEDGQVNIGFALETGSGIEAAQDKLSRKNFNFIVLNSLKDEGAGFQNDTNKVTILDDRGNTTTFPLKEKIHVANDIVEYYLKHYS